MPARRPPTHRRSRRASALFAAALAVATVPALTVTSAGAATIRVAVDHGAPAPAGARPVAVPTRVAFDVALTPHDAAGLTALVAAISTPGSPQFRHFLTPAQYVARFAPSWSVVNRVATYFRAAGLTVTYSRVAPLLVRVSGVATRVALAFGTPLRAASINGHVATEFAGTATLPPTVATAITAVDGLSTLAAEEGTATHAHRAVAHASPRLTTPGDCAGATNYADSPEGDGSFLPDQQASAYGITTQWANGINATGQTIAVYELANYVTSDIHTYFGCYGLAPSLTTVNVDGGPKSADDVGGTDGAEGEADLDIEEAGVLAPGAALVVYQGTQNVSTGALDTYQAIASADVASVITTSWGGCEINETSSSDMHAEALIFNQMALQGQTLFASAGDAGSSDCWNGNQSHPDGTEGLAVDDPASQPGVTGVGGLTVTSIASSSPPSTLRESVWGAPGAAGGGGGDSQVWSQPSWQTGDGVPTTGTRMVPDLSVMGDPATGFIEYTGGGWNGIGGTSIGSPIMAAVTATADQACGVRLGLINPTLYAMATADTGFNDVTSGTNSLFRSTRGDYNATVGFDRASGLGSPSPTTFIPDLCTVAGSPTASSVTVEPLAGTADVALGGTVAVTVRTAASAPLPYAYPVVTATEAGATVHVVPLSPFTNASGIEEFAIDTTTPGAVALTVSVGATVLASTSLSFDSSVTATPTAFTHLTAATGGLAAATTTTGQFAAAVTSARALFQETGSAAAVNDTTRFRLGVVDGAPAVGCAGATCVVALDVAGELGVITNATGSSPTYTSVGARLATARSLAAGSLAVAVSTSGTVTVSYETTAGHVALATWHSTATTATVSDLTTRFHLAHATGGTSITSTSASEVFVAVRLGGDLELLHAGVTFGTENVATVTGYVDTGSAAFTGAPVLAKDPTTGRLEVLGRTVGHGLVVVTATAGAPSTLSVATTLATSGVTAAALTPGTVGATSAPDDVLVIEGTTVRLLVDAPTWTALTIATLTSTSISARALAAGAAPLVVTPSAVLSITP